MSAKKVSIQFTSLSNLWNFRLAIEANIFEMNLGKLTITCDCTEAHIALAKQQFKGKVVATKEVTAGNTAADLQSKNSGF